MAKVKFVQIGSDELLYSEYTVKLQEARNAYPGAIIFGTYYDPVKKKIGQEIWANNKQYKVGEGGSDARFYEGNVSPEEYFTEHTEYTPLHGDYYIKKTDLNGDPTDNIEERTAYVYDSVNTVWVALSGNYDAYNVYFPQGIERTELWGSAKEESEVQTECEHMNLKDLMEYYLVKEKFPSTDSSTVNTTIPSWSITPNQKPTLHVSVSEGGAAATTGQSVEVGAELFVETTTYNTSVTATEGTSTAISNGDNREYSLGPSTISGMKYGFWSKEDHDNNEMDASHLVKVQTVTFDGQTVTDASSHSYTTNDTQQTANGAYSYVSSGTSEMKYEKSNFIEAEGTADTVSNTGNATLTLTGRKITVGVGTNTIELQTKNANYWTRTVTGNIIPATNTLYVATNKDGHTDHDNQEKAVNVPSVPVDAGVATKKVDNAGFTSGGTFTAKGVYPIYDMDTKMDVTKINHTHVTISDNSKSSHAADIRIFEKPNAAGNAYYFKVPALLGTPVVEVYAGGVWGPNSTYTTSTETVAINANVSLSYTVIHVASNDGANTPYRIKSFS